MLSRENSSEDAKLLNSSISASDRQAADTRKSKASLLSATKRVMPNTIRDRMLEASTSKSSRRVTACEAARRA